MKPFHKIIIKYSLITFVAFIATWYVVFESPLNIPEYIPFTPIKTNGAILCTIFITVLIIAQKRLIKVQHDISIILLMLYSTWIFFIAECLFHGVMLIITVDYTLHEFLSGIITITLVNAALSFFVAFQLKTRRTGRLILFIIILTVLFNLLAHFFPNLTRNN
ncbi:hypothetical protein SAMN05428975_0563 [Mucilaginibacter sp. OK268]|uniref:hypothetical protein n=1 Tax=Mucilaginibacter sp. OK268 TaxID=1881048 RepID=UPI00088B369D|nr:hypothetical protein [Mucilaginibacter sp. OK268]SDP17149.1 hypothetical protein SAMN05428975_0563 [Mucilaginibacter sp. OK268]